MHRWVLRVRYGDTDRMGFAYYANYLRWFEIGRTELIRSLGKSYREVEEAGVSLPVVEASCRYRKSARYDDAIAIETGIASLERASVEFAYRVVREADGELLATGSTRHCFLAPDGRPARAPEFLTALLERAPKAAPEARTRRD